MTQVELLSPAGTLRHMRYAFAYGADAVYAGLPRYSLRVRNNDFTLANLETGIAEAHAQGRKFYLAANVLPHNGKVKTFVKDFHPIVEAGPDALIMADPGLILQVRETWPEMPIHLSVQANTMNYAAVCFWQRLGIERIILSRELSLDEIAEIRQRCPDVELEVFVHGALCIAYSGRCLLSGYFNRRDPNQGTCTNACRWEYRVKPAGASGGQRHPAADRTYLLEDPGRPGEYMPILEDEHGTYILNSKDLRAVEHVHKLVALGIDCLKIEGRTKSHYYVARTAQVYRQAIDDALAGRPFDSRLIGVLENLANRGYTDGFYQRHHSHEYQNYLQGASRSHRQQFVGEVEDYDPASGKAQLLIKNKLRRGDRIEWISPAGNRDLTVDHLEDLEGNALEEAPGAGWRVRLQVPSAGRYDLVARYLEGIVP
ncbi:putative protease [Methylomarinovum tepidoasis]|uniref:Protease n=1 Tax=Methylomarinovum tepidoasis TaxID=2840183 RepID=A0AAU9CP83_9GAMM|nr:tRNA 5-hydroxyuridine modification protein YegQ [Methylomarinovum sp. IN45]BCX89452.1 putative protease [Methylomarinovum sp. IN45]